MSIVLKLLTLSLIIFGCAENIFSNDSNNNGNNNSNTNNGDAFGFDNTLDILTWNIQDFPKSNNTTVENVADIINQLDVEIIALQEIESDGYFNNLVEQLDGWSGFKANSASYNIDLAFLYDSEEITFITEYEIFDDDSYAFPRSPLVFKCIWDGNEIIVINNHLKAFSGDENEDRRKEACEKLENYIFTNHQNDEVIILGDMNDELTDPNASNVFLSFINSDNYQFADESVATGSSSQWSYPSWPSHIDHIIITDELFEIFDQPYSLCQTIKAEDYLDGGWNEYESNVSDHRPVGIRLQF